MLQPKKPSNGLSEKDNQLLINELTKYAEEGASDDDLREFKNTFISLKKKEDTTSTSPTQKLDSEQKSGSSVTQKSVNKTLPVDEFGVTNFNVSRENKEAKKERIRNDGTTKEDGFFGKLKMQDGSGKDATEISIGIEIEGKETEIPTLVPTLTEEEKNYLLKGGSPIDKSNPTAISIIKKAVDFAYERKKEGKPYFASNNESLAKTDSLGTTDFGKTPFTPETDLNVENFDKAKSIRKDYSNAIYIPEEKNVEFEQEYNAKVNNEGFVNKAKTAVKNWWNNVIDVEPALQVSTDHLVEEKKQAKDELKKELNGKEPTPEQLQKRTKEIFVAKKKGDYQQSLSDSYLESLSDEDRQLVEVKLAKELPTLDKDYVNKTNSFILLGKDIDAIDKELAQMKRIVKEQSEMGNNNLDPKFYKEARRLEDLRRNKIIVAKSMDDELYKSKAKLGSALEEYDNFKRSYGDFDVLANRLKSGIADIGYGLSSFKNYVNRADRYFGTEIEGITPEIAEIEKSEKEVDFAKKVIDKEQEFFRKRVKEVNGIGDFINYTTDVVGDQIPNMLPFMLTGGLGGGAVIFGSSTGNQYAEMIDGEINQTPFSRIYTDEEKVVAPFVFGVSDAALSAIPTWGRMLRGKRTIQSALKEKGGVDLFAKSSLETAKKGLLRIGKDNASEQLEEQGANLIQNFTKVVYLKQEGATMLDGVEDVFKDTATFSTLLSAFPVAIGGVIKSVSSADQISKFDENAKQIIALKQRLSNSDLSVSQKSIIQSQIDKKTVESKKMISDIQKKFKNKGTEILESVNDVNRSINETLTKAKEIKESNLPKSEKEVILDGLKQDYSAGIDKREKLLSDKSTILDTLSDSEQIKLKDKAQRELRKELEVKGETKIELNDEQITKKAIELYEESKPKAVVEQEPETQPQAEIQKTEQEVTTPNSVKEFNKVGREVGLDKPIRSEFEEGEKGDKEYGEANIKHNQKVDELILGIKEEGVLIDNEGNEYDVEITSQGVRVSPKNTNDYKIYARGKRVAGETPFTHGFTFKPKTETKQEAQPQAEKQSESKKVEIPDWHKQEYDERLEEYDNDISDAKKSLEEEKAKGFFIRSKSWIKFYEDNIKFYEDKAKLLQENPIEFYKSELKGVKEQHEKRLLDKTTYKQSLIDDFGTTDFEVTHSNFIEDTNRKISDYEKVKKTAEKQAEVAEVKQPKSNNNQINEVNENAVLEENIEPIPDSNQIKNDLSKKSTEELEKRQFELEEKGFKSFTKESDEFGEIDKELEKREWQSVLNSPIEDIPKIIDELQKKDKEMPNGFGSYIEKRDARETKEIAEKYSQEVSKEEAKKDFRESFFGNPDTWYADALKMRESVRAFTEKGGTFKELLKGIQREFELDGFSEQDAAGVINNKLSKIAKSNETTPSQDITPDANVQLGVGKVGEMAVEEKPTAEVVKKETVQPTDNIGEVEQKQLTAEQQKNNRLLDLKSEFNSLNNREKKGKRGAELRLRIATIAGELDYKVDEKLGKISITRKSDGKNVGKVSFKEEIKESNQSDIDFVKGQIEQGALAWNGDPMSPRINLGISRADITKGISDIEAGKVNSVPAKRLVQAMAEQRKKGVYEFIQGSGQNIERLEIPIVEDLNPQEQEVADVLENSHTDEEIARYFTELEQLNQEENEKAESITEKIDDTSDSEAVIEKPTIEGKDNVKEKITEDQLPAKKGEKSVIPIGENVEAVIVVDKDLSGEPILIVSILKDGEVQEDKFGDTEVEFSMDEKAEVLKFIEDKKKGYSLVGKGKKGKDAEVKVDVESGKNVTFELFGETKNGVLQSDGSIIGTDGTRYTPSMVKNVRPTKSNDDIQDDELVAGQGFFSNTPNQRDIALSKEGIVYDKAEYFKKFKRFWNQTFRTNAGAPKIIANIIRSLGYERSAFTTVLKHEVQAINDIERTLRIKFPKEADFVEKNIIISDYLAGKKVDVSFLNNEQIADLDYLRARIDGLSNKLIDKLNEKMETLDSRLEEAEEGTSKYESLIDAKERLQNLIDTINNNKGQYIHRSYQAFSDPKYLDALMSENVNKAGKIRLRNAIDFVMAENNVSEHEAKKQIFEYLDGLRGKNDFISAITNGKARAPFLKKRKDIPQPIRELLGEAKEPIFNYVNTVFKISDYLASLEYQEKMSRALLNMPEIASLDAKEGFTQLTSNSDGWTTLSGIYVKEELANAIDDLQPLETVNSGFYSGWIKFVAFTKLGKTVLAPTTTARNLISGTFLSLNAGFNPFVSKKQVLKSIQIAFGTEKSMTDMKKETVKLIKLGIVNDGAVSGEILATLNDFSKSMDRMLKKSPLDKGLSPQERATAVLEKGLLAAQTLYKFGDDFYKIIGFYQYKQRYMKSGMTETESEAKAAERITDTFPTYSKIPKTIQRLRRLPIIGSFPSFSYEVYRTTYNGLKYVNEDRKEGRNEMMAQQIAGMVMANASLYALSYFSMAMLGIDDEDDDFIRDGLPEWQRNAQLIYTSDDGMKPTFIDGTALFPGEVIMKPLRTLLEQRESRTSPAKTKQAIQEFSGPFTDLDINSKTMIDLLINKKDNGKPIYEGENLAEGVFKDPNKVADYFMKQAGPGIYNNMTEFARANEVAPEYFGDKTTPYGREYTNQDALLALFGFRFSTINYQSLLKNVGFEMKFKYDLYRNDLNKKIKSTSVMDKEKINGLVDEYSEKNEDIFKSLVNGVQTARKLGMSDPEISKSLELGNYSKIDIKNLLRGNTPLLKEITDASLKSQFKEIEINYTDEQKAKTLKENLSKNVKIYNYLIKKKNNEDKKILETQGFSRPRRPSFERPKRP